MLRAVLEIETYSHIINRKKLLKDFDLPMKSLNKCRKAVLVTSECNAAMEAEDLANRPKLRKLIRLLDVDIFKLGIGVGKL